MKKFKAFHDAYKKRLANENVSEETRMQRMLASNPRYILRNWIAQKAISEAEKDDFAMVKLVLKTLEKPYEINDEAEKAGLSDPVPDWASRLVVSCSS